MGTFLENCFASNDSVRLRRVSASTAQRPATSAPTSCSLLTTFAATSLANAALTSAGIHLSQHPIIQSLRTSTHLITIGGTLDVHLSAAEASAAADPPLPLLVLRSCSTAGPAPLPTGAAASFEAGPRPSVGGALTRSPAVGQGAADVRGASPSISIWAAPRACRWADAVSKVGPGCSARPQH